MAVVVFAVIGAMQSLVVVSDAHRKAATADTVIREYAESLKEAVSHRTAPQPWCEVSGSHVVGAYTVTQEALDCPDPDPAIAQFQKIRLTVSAPNGRDTETLKIVIRQP